MYCGSSVLVEKWLSIAENPTLLGADCGNCRRSLKVGFRKAAQPASAINTDKLISRCALGIRDTLDTAGAFGFAPPGATFERRGLGRSGFDTIIEMWLPLAWALNMVNRSMGRDDLYPFVLPAVVLDKMRFIRTVIDEMACDPAKLASTGSRG
jgi:Putative zinc-binding metallo-peptidase